MNYNPEVGDPDSHWYAVWTRARQEKIATKMLSELGVRNFLPLKREVRQWSDRKQPVEVPLFSGYLFVLMNPRKESRLPVLKVPGVVAFVGNQSGPAPIPNKEIEDIRTVLASGQTCSVAKTLLEGDRVRVVHGAFAGVEGILVRINSESRLFISIDMIQQAIVVKVSPEDVERVDAQPVPDIGAKHSNAA